jgi:hypothetical protein
MQEYGACPTVVTRTKELQKYFAIATLCQDAEGQAEQEEELIEAPTSIGLKQTQ